jgi:radical SAM superfamily enzyme YgiQ (UPF0313 family)
MTATTSSGAPSIGAIEQGITTATFHIQTPYPGTRLYERMIRAGRMLSSNWDLFDTRHVVYQPARLTAGKLKAGYDWLIASFTGGLPSPGRRCITVR